VQASIYVVRAFIHMRDVLNTHRELAQQLAELETKCDAQFQEVFRALHLLLDPERPEHQPIGFGRKAET
jgi:hypothetical protein